MKSWSLHETRWSWWGSKVKLTSVSLTIELIETITDYEETGSLKLIVALRFFFTTLNPELK